jgi:hypothetical protein
VKTPSRTLAAVVATALIALPGAAFAANPELRLPDFSHLESKARESVNITIDGYVMRLAKAFAAKQEGGANPALGLLDDIRSVQVKSFEFDGENEYSKSDVESVRKQLRSPGWSSIAQVRKRERSENVDVYLCTEGQKILGLAVIASQPKSFTIVNVIGSIDVDKLSQLEGELGIPKVGMGE